MPFGDLPRLPALSATSRAVPVPPIPACRTWADAYDGRAGPRIDLTQAVPGYAPHPELLRRLGAAAGSREAAGYGPLEGETAFREAAAEETRRLYGGAVDVADVRITAGANLGFTLAMAAIAAPGDQVILPAPWFFNHQMALALRGVQAVPLPCRAADAFLPDPERAAALIGPRVRALVLVTPNNPTGAVLPPALIAQFAALCRAAGIWLVLDETYRDFLPTAGEAPHRLFEDPSWRDGMVQLYSYSKAYCIPGHRMGSVIAGPALLDGFMKAVDNIQICPPRPPQIALAWGVPALLDWRDTNRAGMAAQADAFSAAVERAPGWRVDARGGYFAWVRVPDGAPDSPVVAERLARGRGLVTLPGTVFGPGGERHLRLACATIEPAAMAAVTERLAGL